MGPSSGAPDTCSIGYASGGTDSDAQTDREEAYSQVGAGTVNWSGVGAGTVDWSGVCPYEYP
ncbi:hypothetical protein ACFVEN_12980 [Streptomyces sp. NPDC057681]|uniref:hypothetical protein n=1 Tax=Streptomyces sp. NPDC057681 TaxID=3346209 RepID=UPI0036C3A2CE